jgi:DNA-binding MarR family transcriptional regulator
MATSGGTVRPPNRSIPSETPQTPSRMGGVLTEVEATLLSSFDESGAKTPLAELIATARLKPSETKHAISDLRARGLVEGTDQGLRLTKDGLLLMRTLKREPAQVMIVSDMSVANAPGAEEVEAALDKEIDRLER